VESGGGCSLNVIHAKRGLAKRTFYVSIEETHDGATIHKDLFDGAVPERDQLCSVRESTLNLSVGVPVEKRGRPWVRLFFKKREKIGYSCSTC
jgi:hypothetical protein